jgi:hypothetical protein
MMGGPFLGATIKHLCWPPHLARHPWEREGRVLTPSYSNSRHKNRKSFSRRTSSFKRHWKRPAWPKAFHGGELGEESLSILPLLLLLLLLPLPLLLPPLFHL